MFCFLVEQRRLLKPFSSNVWGLFRRVKTRFHELRLHAEDVLIQLDVEHDHCVDLKVRRLALIWPLISPYMAQLDVEHDHCVDLKVRRYIVG
jgi:hypothetical protein